MPNTTWCVRLRSRFAKLAYMTDLINLEITDPACVIVPLMAANVCFIARQIVYPEDRASPGTFSGCTISLSRTDDTAQQVGISRVIDRLFVPFCFAHFSVFFLFFFSVVRRKGCIEFSVDIPFGKWKFGSERTWYFLMDSSISFLNLNFFTELSLLCEVP